MHDYSKVYHKGSPKGFQQDWAKYVAVRRWDLIKKYMNTANPSVIEVGFGKGIFMEASSYPNVYGIDIDNSAVKRMKEKNYNVKKADINKIPFRDGKFDLVYLSHVLEHTFYPEKALREILRILKKNGIVCIVVPDIRRHKFNFYVDHTHKSPFTKESMINLLKLFDCKTIHVRYGLYHDFYWDYFLKRFKPLRRYVYAIKEFLGRFFNVEMIIIAQKQ